MKSTNTLFSLIAGYIFSLLVFRIWYFTSGTPIMEIVVVVVLVTVLYALFYFFILSFNSLQIPWKSFLLVLILTLSLPILIQNVYHDKYRLGRVEEKKLAEEIRTIKEARMKKLTTKINDVNKTITVLNEMLEFKNNENDKLRRQLNKIIRITKRDTVIQTESNKDFSDTDINSEAGNTDFDTKIQEIIFKVQIITSGTRLSINSSHFKDLKNVWEYKEGGLYKYTVGNEVDLKSASVLQSEFRRKGFSEAFVVAFKNGIRISVREAKKLLG